MWFDLPAVQTQHVGVPHTALDSPLCTTSGRSTRHLLPLRAHSGSASTRIGSTRLLGSVSLLAVSSFRQREMSLGLKMRAAEVGIVFWKKLRSSTFIARLTGGANMSGGGSADMEDDGEVASSLEFLCSRVWVTEFLKLGERMTHGQVSQLFVNT